MGDSTHSAVAVIGAGPYGLSIAAHLRAAGVDFRIFGTPMHSWRAHMPKGMFLKSEGCASSLSDPSGHYTLARYCATATLPYGDYAKPVSLETFTQYGLAFQQRLIPTVEDVMVTALDRSTDRFELRLSSGETLSAGKVVVATGIFHAQHIPPALAALPPDLVTHSGQHDDLGRLKGRNVIVIGGGQSALESAALLHEAGADVRLLVRRPSIAWNSTPTGRRRPFYVRMRRPMSSLGPGLGLWLYSNAPNLFWYLPPRIRIARTRTVLGPAGAWWLRERVDGRVPVMLGCAVQKAEACGDGVLLHVQGSDGEVRRLKTDHVIAGTGYRWAVRSQPFLSEGVRTRVRTLEQTPVLSPNFESSVPGLYFVGLASANQFGPAMRFVVGAHYTARRVSQHIVEEEKAVRSPLSAAGTLGPKCHEFVAEAGATH